MCRVQRLLDNLHAVAALYHDRRWQVQRECRHSSAWRARLQMIHSPCASCTYPDLVPHDLGENRFSKLRYGIHDVERHLDSSTVNPVLARLRLCKCRGLVAVNPISELPRRTRLDESRSRLQPRNPVGSRNGSLRDADEVDVTVASRGGLVQFRVASRFERPSILSSNALPDTRPKAPSIHLTRAFVVVPSCPDVSPIDRAAHYRTLSCSSPCGDAVPAATLSQLPLSVFPVVGTVRSIPCASGLHSTPL